MFSSASFILKGSSQSHIVAKTATRDFRLTFYPAQSPRKKTTVFLVGPLRTQGMRLTRPFLNQYPPMAESLCYSDWPHLGDVPICEFQGHGCEWARVTASCTTWTEMVKEGPPNRESECYYYQKEERMLAWQKQQASTAVRRWKGHPSFCVPEIQLQSKELLLFPDVLTLCQQGQNI